MTAATSAAGAARRAGSAALRGWRHLYGENPLHLIAMVGCFALWGYVVSLLWDDPSLTAIAIWFAGAVIGHDLVLYPLYALADQPLTILRWGRRRVLPRRPPLVPAINHLRVPALACALLGLVYFPSVTGRGAEAFGFTAGHPALGQYDNWLLITGALFTGSAVLYALRLAVAGGRIGVGALRRRSADEPEAVPAAPDGPDASGAPTEAFGAPAGADEPTAALVQPDHAAAPTEALAVLPREEDTEEPPGAEPPAEEPARDTAGPPTS